MSGEGQGGVVLIPSYNSGTRLVRTLEECLAVHRPVVVISDASTDGSEAALEAVEGRGSAWHLLVHAENGGKGQSVLSGLEWAEKNGYESALVVDADGQHPAVAIPEFFSVGKKFPGAMVLGVPVFGDDAPALRVYGRKVGNWWTQVVTLWGGIGDSLFGFRLYPVAEALRVMRSVRTARRYDFDTELAVRLYWEGVRPINRPVPVYYPRREEGGVSHFRYVRDNLLLIKTHTGLFFGMLARLSRLLRFRRRPSLLP